MMKTMNDDDFDESDDDNLNRCDRVKMRTSPREPLWKMVEPCDAYGDEIQLGDDTPIDLYGASLVPVPSTYLLVCG
jgi:hypothetical protein